LTATASGAHPDETGGILIVVYADEHPWLIAAAVAGKFPLGETLTHE
jgi:hypothetical protein